MIRRILKLFKRKPEKPRKIFQIHWEGYPNYEYTYIPVVVFNFKRSKEKYWYTGDLPKELQIGCAKHPKHGYWEFLDFKNAFKAIEWLKENDNG